MYNEVKESGGTLYELSSRLCYVDRCVEDCKEYLHYLGFSQFTDFVLVMRELLINAIEHGNKNDIERTVSCKIENRERGRFKIIVQDQGEGFEYKRLNLNLPKSADKGRRCGYPLIYALSDKVQFNTEGNQVTAYVTIPLKIEFDVKLDNLKVIITPSGDLTATSAEDFRAMLIKLYDEGHSDFYFDLKNVSDMDSISLGVFFSFGKMLKDKKELAGTKGSKPLLANVEKRLLDFFILTGLDQLYALNGDGKE